MKIFLIVTLAICLTTLSEHAISADGLFKTDESVSLKSLTSGNSAKSINTLFVIDNYGFEASEGFSPGFLGSQAGWTVLSSGSTVQPLIGNSDPSSGSQHLQLGEDSSLPAGTNIGGLSPDLGPQTVGNESRVSVDVKITANLGASYTVFAQAPSAGLGTWNVNFDSTGNIYVADDIGGGFLFIDSGTAWPVNTYFNLEVITNPGGSSGIEYYLNGTLFYTQATMLLSDTVEQIVLYSDNNNSGDVANFDNLMIDSNFAGGGPSVPATPVPSIGTLGLILMSLGLLFIVRRKLVL